MKTLSIFFIILFSTLTSLQVFAQDLMPPLLPWDGKSKSLLVDKSNPWVTPFELSGGLESPNYSETMAWMEKLASSASYMTMTNAGISEQGRVIHLLIASRDQDFSASELSTSQKPLILIQAGIHAGEIDGKDAGMMLLRDIAFGEKKELLNDVNILFIPILNVDGHERSSEFGRVNQRGPKVMGWRTNAKNLNLNRDYTKLETAGVQTIVDIINKYDPDLYIDVHVTDGADYQYDITYGFVETGGYSPAISSWLTSSFKPEVNQALKEMGHIPGPLLFAANGDDFSEGNIAFSFSPRFSHTYGDIRHMASILIENHSLKPFEQRVLGTYVFLEQAIRSLGSHFTKLEEAVALDKDQPKESIVVKYKFRDTPADSMKFLGIVSSKVKSEVTGAEYVQWEGKAIEQKVPTILMDQAVSSVPVPRAYWVSSEWSEVIQKIKAHGIQVEQLEEAKEVRLEFSRLTTYSMGNQPYEGEMRVRSFEKEEEYRNITMPAGSIRIPTDQPLGELAVILAEAESVDSFFQWGYFNSTLSQTEYMEQYIMEPLLVKMLQEDLDLKKEFDEKMESDPEFAKAPRAIYRWFYAKTPYFDQNWKVIPVGREWQ